MEPENRQNEEKKGNIISENKGLAFIAGMSAAFTIAAYSMENTRPLAWLFAMPALPMALVTAERVKEAVCPQVCEARNNLAARFQARAEGKPQGEKSLSGKVATVLACPEPAC